MGAVLEKSGSGPGEAGPVEAVLLGSGLGGRPKFCVFPLPNLFVFPISEVFRGIAVVSARFHH